MKRPLAILVALAATSLAVVVPAGVAANAETDTSSLNITGESAVWKDSALTVKYSWDSYVQDSTIDVLVDGTSVKHTDAGAYGAGDVTVTVPRAASAAPASIAIAAHQCDYDADTLAIACVDQTVWTGSATRTVTPPKPPRGKSSAAVLLSKLKIKGETHSSSYRRSKFKLWVDANGDHEDTRAEVLKSESKKKATLNSRHTVKTGKWISPYDGKTVMVASKLDIDHMVPLQEAWTSGAYSWSANKREAYANDLGYGASLIAVTKHANRSKGDKEPNGYLPTLKSYRCSYTRNWIAVKARWGLSVDRAEKTALTADLTTYCTSNDWVTSPGKPVIAELIPKPKPKPAPAPGGGGGGSTHGLDPRYPTCTELLKHPNHAPYQRGVDPEYNWYQDRDGDGLVCE